MLNPRALAVLLLCPLLACQKDTTGDTGDTGDTAAEAVSYDESVQALFNRSCISCHNAAGTYAKALSVNMSLEEGDSYDALVGVDAVELPTMQRVAAGDAEASYLWHKLNDTHLDVGGGGDEMPPGLTLASNDLDPIRLWISQGALR